MKELFAFAGVLCLLAGPTSLFADDPGAAGGVPMVKSAPLKIVNNRVLTYVSVNGCGNRAFLVDNCWSQTTIDSRLKEETGFQYEGEVRFNALNKKDQVGARGIVPEMRIGELEICDAKVRCSEIFKALNKRMKLKLSGVVAYETMRPYLTTFDFKKRRMFFAANTPEAVAAMEGNEGVIVLPFGECLFSGVNEHTFTVRIGINGREVDALFDLGFDGSIMTSLDPRELGLRVKFDRSGTPGKVMGRTGTVRKAVAGEVLVGDHLTKGVQVYCFDSEGAPDFTMMGVEFLRKFTFTLDYRGRKVYLAPNSRGVACEYYITL